MRELIFADPTFYEISRKKRVLIFAVFRGFFTIGIFAGITFRNSRNLRNFAGIFVKTSDSTFVECFEFFGELSNSCCWPMLACVFSNIKSISVRKLCILSSFGRRRINVIHRRLYCLKIKLSESRVLSSSHLSLNKIISKISNVIFSFFFIYLFFILTNYNNTLKLQ